MKKFKGLWCPQCKKWYMTFIERYIGTLEETRKFDSDGLPELQESNIDTLEYENRCIECKSLLEEK